MKQKSNNKIVRFKNFIKAYFRYLKTRKSKKIKLPKKKISTFHKVNLALLLTLIIVTTYFVILISTSPKSFPYVTNKIEKELKKHFGDDVAIDNSYINFTYHGTFKIAVTNLRIFYPIEGKSERREFVLPNLETEFSLVNLLLLRFVPKKIKIANSMLMLGDVEEFQASGTDEDHLILLEKFLTAVKENAIPIQNFEIENSKIFLKKANVTREIFIKKSQIFVTRNNGLNIITNSLLNLGAGDIDSALNCNFSELKTFKCDLNLNNFIPSSVANLHPQLARFSNINAKLHSNISFGVKDGEIANVNFKVKSESGNFEFLDFFSQKIYFSDLTAVGEYDGQTKIFNFSELKADFINNGSKTNFLMSILISDFGNSNGQKSDFYIKLENAPTAELEKLWPVFLNGHEIRHWVITHIKNGVVKNAYTKFSLLKKDDVNHLDAIDATLAFSGFDLNYDSYFPKIDNISGIANFTKNGMKIAIADAQVLQSRIFDSTITIDDFSKAILVINGKTKGDAANSLQHANYNSEFATGLTEYLNGDSQNNFDIRLPLYVNPSLKNSYIAVNSAIVGLKNKYINGGVIINSKKDFNSEKFISNIDLTMAEVTAEEFDIVKKSGIEGSLDFTVSVATKDKIILKNILLKKKAENRISPKVFGNIEFNTNPFKIISFDFSNKFFGKNDYVINYKTNHLSMIGRYANVGGFVKTLGNLDHQNNAIFDAQIIINKAFLLNNKSINNFYLALKCNNGFCYNFATKGNYNKKSFVTLRSLDIVKDGAVQFEGEISDVGYIAEGFGISNLVVGGDAKIKLQSKIIDKKQTWSGEITISNAITFYENQAVKRLEKNDLFSQIKDKIFSNNKTTFDNVKLNFDIGNDVLNINSLIANNYKIGITAKGQINLKTGAKSIKGMIVPGFIINNLFGIGNIPLIGGVISGLLTGGEGGGLFGIRYDYTQENGKSDPQFETHKVESFVPTTIKNLFDVI